jgi:CRISPR-associated endonuclease Csn1
MVKLQSDEDYFIGLDCGTSSVGWAVTREDYSIPTANGKALWGIRLFEEGSTAADRRTARSSRRRGLRKKKRLKLLREFFEVEINNVDPQFFDRLDNSKYWLEDKAQGVGKFTLFPEDGLLTDKTYGEMYPTIWHLRNTLANNSEDMWGQRFDIRLYFLAIQHILKKRGHFLFNNFSADNMTAGFDKLFDEFERLVLNNGFCFNDIQEIGQEGYRQFIENGLKMKGGITAKKGVLKDAFIEPDTSEDDFTARKSKVALTQLIALLAGGKVQAEKLFDKTEEVESKTSFSLSDEELDGKLDEMKNFAGEGVRLIEQAKLLYDWGIIADLMQGADTISEPFVGIYEQHKQDLCDLKELFKNYVDKQLAKKFFDEVYSKYVGRAAKKYKNQVNGLPSGIHWGQINQEELCKEIMKLLPKDVEEDAILSRVFERCEDKVFLPKQVATVGGTIPYQIHSAELSRILKNMGQHYQFVDFKILEEDNEDFETIAKRLVSILEFRVPYYVGPINDSHSVDRHPELKAGATDRSKCWVVKNPGYENVQSVLPWTFDKVVDRAASAEKFILRMTNKCTYLRDQDVLPKQSILYSEYSLLNELNNIKIDGERISPEVRHRIFENEYLKNNKSSLTAKQIKQFLIGEGVIKADSEISGFDYSIKGNIKPFHDMMKVFDGVDTYENREIFEEVIKAVMLLKEDKDMLISALHNKYPQLTNDQLDHISKLSYSGWGNFSKKLLTDIKARVEGTDQADLGQEVSIIDAMRATNKNFMQLMSGDFDFIKKIEEHNKSLGSPLKEGQISYSLVEDLYCSPAVKKMIWQTLKVVKELQKINKHDPAKIFVEVAREDGEKGKTTQSRKKQLMDLYSKISGDDILGDIKTSLEGEADSNLRSKKLYLYYTQMGKCAYTGEPIILADLNNSQLYDIDHIYPRSKTKDDAITRNLVLVKAQVNREKTNSYPIASDIRSKMKGVWWNWQNAGLITKEKYERLIRATPLTPEELMKFVDRQLVETRQSTKETARILKEVFPKCEIVYSKAPDVSAFRQEFDLVKVREINDYHHAKDAYLNIIVGNVYYNKFTAGFKKFGGGRQWLKENENFSLNFDTIFRRNNISDVKGNLVWEACFGGCRLKGHGEKRTQEEYENCQHSGTPARVIAQMSKNNILFTRECFEKHGAISNLLPVKKGSGQLSLKSNEKFMKFEQYGGYSDVAGSFWALVESLDKKGKPIRVLQTVPVHIAQCSKTPLELNTSISHFFGDGSKVIIPIVKIKSLIKYNGFPMQISGRTGNAIVGLPAVQLVVDVQTTKYIKNILKFNTKIKPAMVEGKEPGPEIGNFDKISEDQNVTVFDILVDKLTNTLYSKRPGIDATLKVLTKSREKFISLEVWQQVYIISEVLKLMNSNRFSADLRIVGGVKQAGGSLKVNSVISKAESAILINQSITGVYETEINLKACKPREVV